MSAIIWQGQNTARRHGARNGAIETALMVSALTIFAALHLIGVSSIEAAHASRNAGDVPHHMHSAD